MKCCLGVPPSLYVASLQVARTWWCASCPADPLLIHGADQSARRPSQYCMKATFSIYPTLNICLFLNLAEGPAIMCILNLSIGSLETANQQLKVKAHQKVVVEVKNVGNAKYLWSFYSQKGGRCSASR